MNTTGGSYERVQVANVVDANVTSGYGVEIFGRVHYEESSYADCTYTRSILSPVGIECPSVADLMAVYIRHCVEVGYLPPPGARQ